MDTISHPRHALTAVCGGIGAGKSVVCRILRAMGYPVYDCDLRARAIMDSDAGIRQSIARDICAEAILADGSIDRAALGRAVFADPARLSALNSLVHGAVRRDLSAWAVRENSRHPGRRLFVETAILYQSGLDAMVSEVWEVDAPEDLRVRRVCLRNGLEPDQVHARISAQRFTPDSPHPRVRTILNDDRHSLLLQIREALDIDYRLYSALR